MKRPQKSRVLQIEREGTDGGAGIIKLPRNNRAGYTKASIIWSWGGGWEHVSVAPFNKTTPTWDDMCFIKDLFWDPEDWVVQFHPAHSQYINNMPNCLHLWRPISQDLPTPPSWMTGVKGVADE